jgi:hypothetical protein
MAVSILHKFLPPFAFLVVLLVFETFMLTLLPLRFGDTQTRHFRYQEMLELQASKKKGSDEAFREWMHRKAADRRVELEREKERQREIAREARYEAAFTPVEMSTGLSDHARMLQSDQWMCSDRVDPPLSNHCYVLVEIAPFCTPLSSYKASAAHLSVALKRVLHTSLAQLL